jgi:putative nucleotide binding protein
MSESETEDDGPRRAIVLDFFPNGRSEGGPQRYDRQPLGYALGTQDFWLYQIVFEEDSDVGIGDEVVVEPREEREGIQYLERVEYEDVSGGAQSELEYVIEDMIEEAEDRFVEFFNDAQPITLRLHQLNLLPGIGKKLRRNILDERKRQPFQDMEDLEMRVSGLHDPKDILAERIVEEIRDDDLKYRIFVAREE